VQSPAVINLSNQIAGSHRFSSVVGDSAERRKLIGRCLRIARDGLPLMFRHDIQQFAFTRKRMPHGRVEALGESLRYGAITALGASLLDPDIQRPIFGGQTAFEYCGRMLASISEVSNWGDLALLGWAAAELEHPEFLRAFERLNELGGFSGDCETVVASWALAAALAGRHEPSVNKLVETAYSRLSRAFETGSGLFFHRTDKAGLFGRSHIACFADTVYPIQSLARYHRVSGDDAALGMANRCAEQICQQQGSAGQWWWHYDARAGVVVEGYPVYSVHQHAMAPMALFELLEAGGFDSRSSIAAGFDWLSCAPEIGEGMLEEDELVIWRKVGRTDPKKLVRKIRAGASRVHRPWRITALDQLFPPRLIDFECRPYEFGWMLYAWLYNRTI
jgi:hypothetical protein